MRRRKDAFNLASEFKRKYEASRNTVRKLQNQVSKLNADLRVWQNRVDMRNEDLLSMQIGCA